MLSLKFKFLLFEFVNFQSWLNFQKILITALQFETVLVTMASKKYTQQLKFEWKLLIGYQQIWEKIRKIN